MSNTTNNPFINNNAMPTGQAPAPMSSPATNPAPAPVGGSPVADNNSFSIDLTNVSDGLVIPDGIYQVKCTEMEQTISQSGNPMFTWAFETTDGAIVGHQLKYFTALTPSAMWKVAETVTALGVGQTGQVVKFKRSDVINKVCGAVIEKTEYNGQERSQIKTLFPLSQMTDYLNGNK